MSIQFLIKSAYITDKGLNKRYIKLGNQDSFLFNQESNIYAVADGVGGNDGGLIASRITTNIFETISKEKIKEERSYEKAIKDSIQATNNGILAIQKTQGLPDYMMTTFSGICYIEAENILFSYHLGDSRIYLYNQENGSLKQITQDHSNQSGELTSAIGMLEPKVDYSIIELNASSKVLICSDGVTKVLNEEAIKNHLSSKLSVEDTLKKIYDDVYEGKAPDNFTAVLVSFEEKTDNMKELKEIDVKEEKIKELVEITYDNNVVEKKSSDNKIIKLLFLIIFILIFIFFQVSFILISEKYGFTNKSSEIVDTESFLEELSPIKENGKLGVIDKSGKFISIPKFDDAFQFSEGLIAVRKDNKAGFIKKNGELLLNTWFDYEGQHFSFGSSFEETLIPLYKDEKYGYIDKKGRFIVEPIFDISDGLVEIDKLKYLDKNGEIIDNSY